MNIAIGPFGWKNGRNGLGAMAMAFCVQSAFILVVRLRAIAFITSSLAGVLSQVWTRPNSSNSIIDASIQFSLTCAT